MTRINIAPIVEGHGDNAAVRNLLWRTWTEVLGGEHAEILQPIRRARGKLLKADSGDLDKAIKFAIYKLAEKGGGLILILIDAEDDCATYGSLGPLLLKRAKQIRNDADISCVVANVMFETWFAAAAESLSEYLDLAGVAISESPEADRLGKGWIKSHIRSGKYSETADQAALATRMDLHLCRRRSKSFDKLCRELNARKTI